MSARKKDSSGDASDTSGAPGDDSFATLMGALGSVVRIAKHEKSAAKAPRRVVPRRDQEAGPQSQPDHPFRCPLAEEPRLGYAPGVSSRQLGDLQAGRIRPSSKIDLHGHHRDSARALLCNRVAAARRAGERCVLVVHGRGLRSDGHEPVLKKAVPVWLAERPLRAHVGAFAPARPADGGAGAMYLLLR